MSYSETKVVRKNNEVQSLTEYKNAWGGAAFIWTQLSGKYMDDEASWITHSQGLWDLVQDRRLQDFERITLISTFDYVMIKRENFRLLASAYREFIEHYGTRDRVCHLLEIAKELEGLADDKSVQALCFWWNSVGDDLWEIWDDDDYETYDISKGDDHWWLFEDNSLTSVKVKKSS